MIKEITIPEIGENVDSGDVVSVLVSEGDMVDADQGVIEVETEKAVVEIPSPDKGKIVEITVSEGDSVTIGQTIGKIDTEAPEEDEAEEKKAEKPEPKREEREEPEPKQQEKEEEEEEEEKEEEVVRGTVKGAAPEEKGGEAPSVAGAEEKPDKPDRKERPKEPKSKPAPASPSVRRLAREVGADIDKIGGSGPGGRITEEDVKAYVRSIVRGEKRPATAEGSALGISRKPLPDFGKWGKIDKEPLSKVRRITADNVSHSWTVVPHVTQFDEADVTWFEEFRQKFGKEVEQAGGKLTLTAVIIKTIVAALKRYSKFNATVDPEKGEIIYKHFFNIGIAVDTDRGLLVPVLRDADRKGIKQIAIEMTDLAERARKKRIDPDEMEGGTFTISNQGAIGGVQFTPIIFWPQVAILGVSRSSTRPEFIDGEWKPRTILPISLSYDHRLIDGADAARFLKWVAGALEHPLALEFD